MSFRPPARRACTATAAVLPRPPAAVRLASLVCLLLFAGAAGAHPAVGEHPELNALLYGLLHPLDGPGHIVSMLAVGLFAAAGGARLWQLPLLTLAGLLAGALLALPPPSPWLLELAAVVAIVTLGALVAGRTPDRRLGAAVVGALALLYGYAHTTATDFGAVHLAYGLGFVAATLLLQAIGVAAGYLARWTAPGALRTLGLAVSAIGCYLGFTLFA